MRLLPWDPDIATIVSRISSGDIDLQPDFQRGEVWGMPKKERLIDSILRDWHVPPIHVIENSESGKQEVLDGQQRLAAIRDFVEGLFPVDGNTEPFDAEIQSLHALYYQDLPLFWRRRFNQFSIRVFRIVDYHPSEPAELFFRLNQPASLTSAEQRNAFFGPVRNQIKSLVISLQSIDRRSLGFSNSRMAYDDVLARTALAVQRNSIAEKITSADLTALYRSDKPLEPDTTERIDQAVNLFVAAVNITFSPLPKFNKATVFSWLIFLVRHAIISRVSFAAADLASFFNSFESARSESITGRYLDDDKFKSRLFTIFDNRSSSRVADVSSVVLRDAIIWTIFREFSSPLTSAEYSQLVLDELREALAESASLGDDLIARRLITHGWGRLA